MSNQSIINSYHLYRKHAVPLSLITMYVLLSSAYRRGFFFFALLCLYLQFVCSLWWGEKGEAIGMQRILGGSF